MLVWRQPKEGIPVKVDLASGKLHEAVTLAGISGVDSCRQDLDLTLFTVPCIENILRSRVLTGLPSAMGFNYVVLATVGGNDPLAVGSGPPDIRRSSQVHYRRKRPQEHPHSADIREEAAWNLVSSKWQQTLHASGFRCSPRAFPNSAVYASRIAIFPLICASPLMRSQALSLNRKADDDISTSP